MPALRVAIVNDYPVVVQGVEAMLQPYADRVEVAEVVAGREPTNRVDVTLYDAFAAAQLHETVDDLIEDPRRGRVVVYAWDLAPAHVRGALARGCAGYVDKAVPAEELVRAIERAAAGETPVVRGPLAESAADAPEHGRWPGLEADLSPREAEVIALITQGLTNVAIGKRLHLSINTVKTYIRAAYLKIGVSRRPQAVKWGIDHGMLPGSDDEQ